MQHLSHLYPHPPPAAPHSAPLMCDDFVSLHNHVSVFWVECQGELSSPGCQSIQKSVVIYFVICCRFHYHRFICGKTYMC